MIISPSRWQLHNLLQNYPNFLHNTGAPENSNSSETDYNCQFENKAYNQNYCGDEIQLTTLDLNFETSVNEWKTDQTNFHFLFGKPL